MTFNLPWKSCLHDVGFLSSRAGAKVTEQNPSWIHRGEPSNPNRWYIYIYINQDGCFLKWWVYPQSKHPNGWSVLVAKPMGLLGKPHRFRKPSYCNLWTSEKGMNRLEFRSRQFNTSNCHMVGPWKFNSPSAPICAFDGQKRHIPSWVGLTLRCPNSPRHTRKCPLKHASHVQQVELATMDAVRFDWRAGSRNRETSDIDTESTWVEVKCG